MTLRLRHLRIRAQTGEGLFGADLPFEDGLVILRADNSMGKSTAVRSLLFALGLERMTSSHPTQALTAALHDRLIFDQTTMSETPVLESWISLEIEGGSSQRATLTRWVKHGQVDSGLIRVEEGPALSQPGDYPPADYFVGRAGAASNPKGFHRWLSQFLDWRLPVFAGADGRQFPLYLEQVFPLLFVEQKRGWASIQAQTPYFSGLADVRRRAVEFLLGLEVSDLEVERQRLRSELATIQDSWRGSVAAFRERLEGTGVVTMRLPATLALAWPQESPPLLVENHGDSWKPLERVAAELREQLSQLVATPIPSVGKIANEAEHQLSAVINELREAREAQVRLGVEIQRDRDSLHSVRERVRTLLDDLREHQDVLTLQRLGSEELGRLHGDCPVCHQTLPESLLGAEHRISVQSPEETVAYLKQQLQMFELMDRDGTLTLEAKQAHWSGLQELMRTKRAEIRALQDTLTSADKAPSTEHLAQRIRAGERLDRLVAIDETFLVLLETLSTLSERGRVATIALRRLPDDRLTATDRHKLNLLQSSFISQLHAYGFGSFADANLRIGEQDYLPQRDNFDLQAGISASDSIRVIWAYLVGLLEVAQQASTNHPGLVVFDEPRQQSANRVSFEALLRRAGAERSDVQILFATSEDDASLRSMLNGVSHSMHAVDGYLLKPV